ncbi:MAG: DUF6351 family protein [Acidovorax sp.]|uniref:DUF6351 family protein n=1 Tax=Acidovorax sp. TaxID=1872122 RepID=UPI00391C0CAD
MRISRYRASCAGAAVALALGGCGGGSGSGDTPQALPELAVLSSKPELVSGGSALVALRVPASAPAGAAVSVTLNGTDVSSAFKPDPTNPGQRIAVLAGLKLGANVVAANVGGTDAQLNITNYPRSGPMLSGPHQSPYICQTSAFTLPDGSKLGDSTDTNCSAPTKVVYVYRATTGGALKPLPSLAALPTDVATTTTATGATVPFVVRVETGTMNRGVYQNAVLHDPTKEATPSPTAPPAGWNRRLLAVHGSGCVGGWYVQGAALGVSLITGDNIARLGEGYGVFNNSLNHPTNSCNATLAGESTLMGKEHFIKTFGVPAFTVSTGGSGGAYTSLQLADAYPGLFDGVFISSTFPDALSISLAGLDARLLSRYYLAGNTAAFTEAQMVAVSGHKTARAWYDLAMQSGRTDPVPGRRDPLPPSPLPILGGVPYQSAVWNAAVPAGLRYDPVANPTGARPTVFDVARNVYGIDKVTGFALRPFDNVGVQYGLKALNGGAISVAQFLDLNERVGGYDQDANYVAGRVTGDASAIQRAHQSGMQLNGNGGLADIPVFDISSLYDEDNFYHYQWFHFAVRERMAQANGDTRNHVMWRGGTPITAAVGAGGTAEEFAVAAAASTQGWQAFIDWVKAYKADTSAGAQRDKVIARKPAAAVDGCFSKSTTPKFIAETQTLSSKPDTQCNTIWPSWTAPRIEAGGPIAADKLKCALKPVSAASYSVAFSPSELARLQAIFPSGVCDWSKPGINQVGVTPYASFGPSPVNQVFDITK